MLLRRLRVLALRRHPGVRGLASSTSAPPPRYEANAGDTDGPQPMSLFGSERTDLAKACAVVLEAMPSKPRYFLDNGTLLGLWRNGQLIDKDDDFDFGLLVDGKDVRFIHPTTYPDPAPAPRAHSHTPFIPY